MVFTLASGKDRTVTSEGRLPRVRVEFYGLARLRASRKEFHVDAVTVGVALAVVDERCPELRVLSEGRISAVYIVSVNGEEFTTDTRRELKPGDELLIFGADAGG